MGVASDPAVKFLMAPLLPYMPQRFLLSHVSHAIFLALKHVAIMKMEFTSHESIRLLDYDTYTKVIDELRTWTATH